MLSLAGSGDAPARPHLFRSGCSGAAAVQSAGCSGSVAAVRSTGCQGTAQASFSRTRTRTVTYSAPVRPVAVTAGGAVTVAPPKVTVTVQPPPVVVAASVPLPMTAQYATAPRSELVRGFFHRVVDVRPLRAVAGAVCPNGQCGR